MTLPYFKPTQPKKQKYAYFMVHLLAICTLFILPELLTTIKHGEHYISAFYLKPLMMVLIFYVDYLYVFPHTYGRPEWVLRYWAINVAMIAGLVVVQSLAIDSFLGSAPDAIRGRMPHKMPHAPGVPWMIYVRDAVTLILTVGLSLALSLVQQSRELARRHLEQETAEKEAELNRLKSQLQPHFLFNALNTVYALIDVNPKMAQCTVHHLSRMLRYVLYESQGQVTLGKEVEFTENYMAVMKQRLGSRVPATLEVDVESMANNQIAPLVFINLVENTFKHGITGSPDDYISIKIKAYGDGVVECRTSNFYNPEAGASVQGVGINNLRRRLELIYGNRAELKVDCDDKTFTTILKIQL